MTPKEDYEARKAERKAERARIAGAAGAEDKMALLALDMADRFVTAVERIADAMEPRTGVWPGKGVG